MLLEKCPDVRNPFVGLSKKSTSQMVAAGECLEGSDNHLHNDGKQ
jgi:hypothetical protein